MSPVLPIDTDITDAMASLVLTQLRDHVPPNHHVRFKCNEHAAPRNGNGDHDYSAQNNEEILRLFSTLPIVEQMEILNGWHPKILTEKVEDAIEDLQQGQSYPYVSISSPVSGDPPTSYFTRLRMDDMTDVVVSIPAAMTKADAMRQLDSLVRDIDRWWAYIIADRGNEVLQPSNKSEPAPEAESTPG